MNKPIFYCLIFFLLVAKLSASAQVKLVEGNVESLKPNKTKWKDVKVNAKLKDKTKIRTGNSSRVDLLFEDGSSVRFAENAEAFLEQIELQKNKAQRSIELEKGSLLFQIEKLSKGSKFDFGSPSATASVRGTECDYGTNVKRGYLACREGLAKFISKTNNDSVDVCAGCIAIQQKDGSIVLRFIENKDEFEKILKISKDLFFNIESQDFDADSLMNTLLNLNQARVEILIEPDSSRRYVNAVEIGKWNQLETEEQTIKENEFYKFLYWEISGDSVQIKNKKNNFTEFKAMGINSKIKAIYEKEVFVVKLLAENGSIKGVTDTLQLEKGKRRNITVEPSLGYRFINWNYKTDEIKINKIDKNIFEILALKDSIKLEAVFSNSKSGLQITSEFPNSVSPDGLTPLNIGEEITIEAKAPEGYYFKLWKVKGAVKISSQTDEIIKVVLQDSTAEIIPEFIPLPKLIIKEFVNGYLRESGHYSLYPNQEIELNQYLKSDFNNLDFDQIEMDGEGVLNAWKLKMAFTDVVISVHFKKKLKKAFLNFYNETGESKTLVLEYR